jgi:thioredoxin-dependent peroxiredoxin
MSSRNECSAPRREHSTVARFYARFGTGLWAGDIEETQGAALNFPLLADADRKVAQLYDMLQPESNGTATVRSVFVIDPRGVLRLTLTYPASTGRNFDEILRVIDSLQLTDRARVATPVNWQQGGEVVILPAIPNDEADKLFPQGHRQVKPYLRLTRVAN